MMIVNFAPKNIHSRFYTLAVQESKSNKAQLEEKKETQKEKLMKMLEYGDIVKCNYTPKLRSPQN